jgi:hypothetical protein
VVHAYNPSYSVGGDERIVAKSVQETPSQSVRWCAPIIPRYWEAEIGNIMAPGQLGQKSLQDPISMEKGWAW